MLRRVVLPCGCVIAPRPTRCEEGERLYLEMQQAYAELLDHESRYTRLEYERCRDAWLSHRARTPLRPEEVETT